MDDLLAEFLTETNESLTELDQAVLQLERAPDDQPTLSLVFRLVHTIKGTCGFLGLPRLEAVAHAAESVLSRVRDGELSATPGLITRVLAALDQIKAIIAALGATGAEPPGADPELIASLLALAAGETPAPPSLRLVAPEPPAAEPAAPESPTQTIRVAVDVLEDLMTLVSELVLTRNQILQLARTREDAGFTAPLQRLSSLTSELQEGVMKTRMQPIGGAWNKLPRLVRDLARDLDKRIDLVMRGQDTELDRQVLELIRDPLTHMIRNSGDHGLETTAERRAAGKPETGRITLQAFHEGGHIVIEVGDDGRGLPVDRIRAKALQRGLATEAELAAMTDEQIQAFIFRAGFSTASEVTAVSGRGVGMDVVRTNIERIGGAIELRSTPGQGTVFTIKIPLTLAIVSALIVEAAGQRFAIPQISVVELVHAAGDAAEGAPRIERIDGTPVLRLRDRLLPLVSLSRLLNLPGEQDGSYIVVAFVGSSTLGIIVDRVFDTEEIVVKPVAPILRHITMFSGNTILGDGTVILILDPNGIARATGVGASGETTTLSNAHEHRDTSEATTAILVFRAGSDEPKAVPLGLVSRLESIPYDRIENAGGRAVTQFRGKLMPLVRLAPPGPHRPPAGQPVLVFNEQGRSLGLMVDEIVDVVTEHLRIELGGAHPGVLGTAIIAGQATDVIDAGHLLAAAGQDWFRAAPHGGAAQPHLLVVEDSHFFRQLLIPALSVAGYRVTACDSAAKALARRDAGEMFDAVVSDIEMPDMDGLDFARAVRAGGSWRGLPMIALSGRAEPADVTAARGAGFTDHVPKFKRDVLLDSLQRCLRPELADAA